MWKNVKIHYRVKVGLYFEFMSFAMELYSV